MPDLTDKRVNGVAWLLHELRPDWLGCPVDPDAAYEEPGAQPRRPDDRGYHEGHGADLQDAGADLPSGPALARGSPRPDPYRPALRRPRHIPGSELPLLLSGPQSWAAASHAHRQALHASHRGRRTFQGPLKPTPESETV